MVVLTWEHRDRPGSAGLVWEERALMASPDAVGWPDEAVGLSFGSDKDLSLIHISEPTRPY